MDHDANTAECLVYSYKDGLLSRVGHDLVLRCTDFTVSLTPDRVEASFDPAAFEVLHALKKGRPDPGALSARDRRQVLENMRKGVLHPERHPRIHFVSDEVTWETTVLRVRGTLAMHGARRPLSVAARRVDGRWRAEVDLHTPDWGIAPFSALMGTLKVKPRVTVRVSVPAPDPA